MTTAAPLEVRSLTKRFPMGSALRRAHVHAVDDVSFELRPGTITALVGESGSGKSTVARLLAHLAEPSAGEVLFEGNDVTHVRRRRDVLHYRSQVQMIFQDPFGSLNPVKTVRHHVERPLRIHKIVPSGQVEQRVYELLRTVGLVPPEDIAAKYPHELSGGQRQRVAIARALAVEPKVVLADEPISMLDVSIRIGILNLMSKLKEERGIAFLYVTHDLASARYVADDILVMYAGQIVERGPIEDVLAAPLHPYTRLLLDAVPDPATKTDAQQIELRTGDTSAAVDPTEGCRFRARCPLAIDVCSQTTPTLVEAKTAPGRPLPRNRPSHLTERTTMPTDDELSSRTDFLWGAATASYQIEGAAHEDGRGESVWDRFCATPGKVRNGDSGERACDFYHRYPDDIALMRDLGLGAFRFSIAWPRVLPDGRGPVNEAGLDFYDRLVDELLAQDIEPFVTLFHWDTPQALEDAGGWPARSTAEAFAEYAEAVARRLGDRVSHWITHNEPWVHAWIGHSWGKHAPGRTSEGDAVAAAHHLLLSHGWAVDVIRALSPDAQIGISLNLAEAYPANETPEDEAAAWRVDGEGNRWFLDPLYRGAYPPDLLERNELLAPFLQDGDLRTISAPTRLPGRQQLLPLPRQCRRRRPAYGARRPRTSTPTWAGRSTRTGSAGSWFASPRTTSRARST